MDVNLNNELNNILKSINKNNKPNLFLHVCCGPCSTAVLEKLISYFNIYIIFYNPNIDTELEFDKRLLYLNKFINDSRYNVSVIYDKYNHFEFLNDVKGLENEAEGKARCTKCFELRLKHSYIFAKEYIKEHNLDNNTNYLCSTLSISPHKNAKLIYNIGNSICKDSNLLYLPSDFKKENGYLNSIILSKKYNLYRQDYCGCEFSKNA